MKLLLADFQNPESLAVQLVDNGLHRGGFSGSGVTGQQDIGRRLSVQQCLRIVEDDLLLPPVVNQRGQRDAVRVADGNNHALRVQEEHPVLRIDSIAQLSDVADSGTVIGRNVQLNRRESGQESVPVQPLAQSLGRQIRHGLENVQLFIQACGHLWRGRFPAAYQTDESVFAVGGNLLNMCCQRIASTAIEPGEKRGIAGYGLLRRGGFHTVQKAAQRGDDRIVKQRPEDGKGLQADVQIG